jgi:hypothetical protein
LYALARYDQPATVEEIRYALERQGATGWWAMYPATPEREERIDRRDRLDHAGAVSQLERKLVAPEQRDKVAQAIRKATDWLKRRALSGQARWNEYPPEQNFEKGVEYLSVSALVIHTLRTFTGSSEFDALWLRDLPQRVPGLGESEIFKGQCLSHQDGDDRRTTRGTIASPGCCGPRSRPTPTAPSRNGRGPCCGSRRPSARPA